jgi:hypothetical protein
MRRPLVKAIFLLIVTGACLGGPAWAQSREKAWELNPWVGFTAFDKKTGLDDHMSFGFRFGYYWTKHQMVEFGFSSVSTRDSASGDLKADLLTGNVNYVYNFFLQRRDRVVAFVTAGAGVVSVSTFGLTANPDLIGDENDLLKNYGAGIRFFGGRRAGFRVEARQYSFSPSGGGNSQDFIEYSAGMTIVLGGA